MQKKLLILLVVTALVAWFISVTRSYGTFSLVCAGIVCWVVLYWLWKWRDGGSTTRPFWRRVVRRTIILVAGALAGAIALFIFMISVKASVWEIDHRHQVATQLKTQGNRARIEKNKVRIGMTINDVLPLLTVHRMYITASAVVDPNKGYYAPDEFWLEKQADGTFTLLGDYWGERVSGNLTEAQVHERMTKPVHVLENLTDSQVAELLKQKMSDGYEWRWEYLFVSNLRVGETLGSSFKVTFGRDGRVKDITDVQGEVLTQNHRA